MWLWISSKDWLTMLNWNHVSCYLVFFFFNSYCWYYYSINQSSSSSSTIFHHHHHCILSSIWDQLCEFCILLNPIWGHVFRISRNDHVFPYSRSLLVYPFSKFLELATLQYTLYKLFLIFHLWTHMPKPSRATFLDFCLYRACTIVSFCLHSYSYNLVTVGIHPDFCTNCMYFSFSFLPFPTFSCTQQFRSNYCLMKGNWVARYDLRTLH